MASTVFFSFHYNEDWSRMWNIRNSQKFKDDLEDIGTFQSRDRWESVRLRTDAAIKKWIDEGLKYSGVTIVLISGDTWERDWVRYEIEESERQGMGMLGIRVHNLKDLSGNYGTSGPNPFSQHFAMELAHNVPPLQCFPEDLPAETTNAISSG